jgi:lysophospholipase L1-like esterase
VIRSALLSTVLAAAAFAQEPGGAVPANPLRDIADVPGLPRVLIIGDSISMGYTEPVRKLLAGKYNVHRIGENGGPTSNGVAHLDKLPAGPWDVITFNYGLHDLKLDTGTHQVEVPQYEANLNTIVEALRKTGAKLIWVTTTPVPTGKLSPKRERTDVPLYNEAASRSLKDKVDSVCDLYTAVLPREPELQLKENVHFTPAGYDFLAHEVAQSILKSAPNR